MPGYLRNVIKKFLVNKNASRKKKPRTMFKIHDVLYNREKKEQCHILCFSFKVFIFLFERRSFEF